MVSTSHPKVGRPVTGEAQTAAERMRRYRSRQRAAGLRAITRYEASLPARLSPPELDRRIIDARSLALHCLAAKKIDANRALLTRVRQRLDYWRRNYGQEAPPAVLDAWAEVLSKPWGAIALLITDSKPDAARLRRTSPFDIVLTERERKRIYTAFAP